MTDIRDFDVRCQRIYGDQGETGYRVLIDLLWPRGLSKSAVHCDAWRQDLAPSTELRKWFNHVPERWREFRKRYHRELESKLEECHQLSKLAREKTLILLYAAKDQLHNNAIAMKDFLEQLEAQRRYTAGWSVASGGTPSRKVIRELGGIWDRRNHVWTLPDQKRFQQAVRAIEAGGRTNT